MKPFLVLYEGGPLDGQWDIEMDYTKFGLNVIVPRLRKMNIKGNSEDHVPVPSYIIAEYKMVRHYTRDIDSLGFKRIALYSFIRERDA